VAKDSPRITDGELQGLVESWGSETCCLGGFQEKDKLLAHPKTNCISPPHIQISGTTGTSKGTGFCGQMKLTFASKPIRCVWCKQG